MTTPLIYLSSLVQKRYQHGLHSSFIYRVEELILSEFIEGIEFQLNHKQIKNLYLDYFIQFNSFSDLCLDIFTKRNSPYHGFLLKIMEIEEVFVDVFPLQKDKLLKIWNLNPKGVIFDKERKNMRVDISSPKRGWLKFSNSWESSSLSIQN